jgi:tetratricopeptide (TPR) repeat protein
MEKVDLSGDNFVGRESELKLFAGALSPDAPPPFRILSVYGIGGIGKSQLLDRYKAMARAAGVPVVVVDAEYDKMKSGILERVYKGLKGQGLKFRKLEKSLKRLKKLQDKVSEEAGKSKGMVGALASVASKSAKLLPYGGLVADVADPAALETIMHWAHQLLGKQDAEFLKSPEDELTAKLVDDLNDYCAERRLILAFDTYEKMPFDDWVRGGIVRELKDGAVTVVVGQQKLHGEWWKLAAPGALVERHLELFSQGEAQKFLLGAGVSDRAVVEAMVNLADGLPLTLSMLFALREDRKSVSELTKEAKRPDFLERLMERVLNQEVMKALWAPLEALAVFRTADEDKLKYMVGGDDAESQFDQVEDLSFVEWRDNGLTLHRIAWRILNEYMRRRNATRYRELHLKAAEYYGQRLQSPGDGVEGMKLEWLYHRIRHDEADGVRRFRDMAEELAGFWLPNQLSALLTDVSSYELADEHALWRDYFEGRLKELRFQLDEAVDIYKRIIDNPASEPRLRAYALYECGQIYSRVESKLSEPGGAEEVLGLLRRSIEEIPELDAKVVSAYSQMRRVYLYQGDWEEAIRVLHPQLKFYEKAGDLGGMIFTYVSLKEAYALVGDWAKAYKAVEDGRGVLKSLRKARSGSEYDSLEARLMGFVPWLWAWSGRYREAEEAMLKSLKSFRQTAMVQPELVLLKDLGLITALQNKQKESAGYFGEAESRLRGFGDRFIFIKAGLLGFRGLVRVRQGKLKEAAADLGESLDIKLYIRDDLGLPELYVWLGELYEAKARNDPKGGAVNLNLAESNYLKCLELRRANRWYFQCAALVGLARIMQARREREASARYCREAAEIASRYEYNDHLSSLLLVQGHAAFGQGSPARDGGFDAALRLYQRSLVHALRYNRFLLDEVTSGRGQWPGTQPIIPACLKEGERGARMLSALKDWWGGGINETDPRIAHPVTPVAQGVPLRKAESAARKMEPGDGARQVTVAEQLKAALDGAQYTAARPAPGVTVS